MTTLKRLLLATTLLTAAGAGSVIAAPQGDGPIILAQQPAPEPEKKDGKPPAKPAPAGKPAPAQQAPQQAPQRPAAPARPAPPPAAQQPAPPPAAQPRRPDQPPPAARQPQPPAAQQPVQRREPPQQPATQTAPQGPSRQPAQTQTPPPPPAAQTPQQRRDQIQRPAERTPPPRTPQAQPAQPAAPPPPPAAQTPAQRPAVQTQPQAPATTPVPPPPTTQRPAAPDAPPPSAQERAPRPGIQTQPAPGLAPVPPATSTQRPASPDAPPAGQIAPAQPPAAQSAPQPTAAQPQRIEDVRQQRREERREGRTFIVEGDRTIIREGDRTIIRRDEAQRFRFNARDVRVDRRGNEIRTVAIRPDGTQIVTITDDDGRLIRRSRRDPRGHEVIIIDNSFRPAPRFGAGYYVDLPPPVIRIPRERYIVEADQADEELLYETMIAPPVERIERRYTLDEVRYSPQVRDRMPRIDIDTVHFETGSWEVTPDQIARLAPVAEAIRRAIARNPNEVYLIEGHTDAVGSDIDNLSLSDRRAESVARLLTDEFQIPPENLTTQGYGEQYLKIPTEGPERRNRRVAVRRITPLIAGQGNGPAPQ